MDQPPPADASGCRSRITQTLTVTVSRFDGALVLSLEGDIDAESQLHFSEYLTAAVDEARSVVVDLRDVSFMDSSGLAALVGAGNRARAREVCFSLRNPSSAAKRVLHISGVDQVLTVEPDGSAGAPLD